MAKLTNAQLAAELVALRTAYEGVTVRLADAEAKLEKLRTVYRDTHAYARELLAENERLKAAKPVGRAAGPRASTYVPKAPDADTVAYRIGMQFFRKEAMASGKNLLVSRADAIAKGHEIAAASVGE